MKKGKQSVTVKKNHFISRPWDNQCHTLQYNTYICSQEKRRHTWLVSQFQRDKSCCTVHTVLILQRSPDPTIFHELEQPLSCHGIERTAKLSACLGDSPATGCCRWGNTADCRSFGWQDISSSGLATKTLIFFYLRKIMQQSDKSIKRLSIPMYISPWMPYCTCILTTWRVHDSRYTM